MSANLPILWNDKKNSKELEAFLAQYGPEYCFSAEEINQLRDAVNEMGVIQNYIKSNESLSLAKRKNDVLHGILDQYTGEEMTLSKVTGTPVVDGIIYFQLEDEYFKRNYTDINPLWFGAKGNGVANDSVPLLAAINALNAKLTLEIKFNYNLGGASIVLPANVTLCFEGGSITNGSVTLNNTTIAYDNISSVLSNVVLTGTLTNDSLDVRLFGILPNNNSIDATTIINSKLITLDVELFFPKGNYYFTELHITKHNFKIRGVSGTEIATRTTFNPFNLTQYYIIKLGGGKLTLNDASAHIQYPIIQDIHFTTPLGYTALNLTSISDITGIVYRNAALVIDKVQVGKFAINGNTLHNTPLVSIGASYEMNFDYINMYGNHGKSDLPIIQFANNAPAGEFVSATIIDKIQVEVFVGPVIKTSNQVGINELTIGDFTIEGTIEWENESIFDETRYTHLTKTLPNYYSTVNRVPLFDLNGTISLVISTIHINATSTEWSNSLDPIPAALITRTFGKFNLISSEIQINNILDGAFASDFYLEGTASTAYRNNLTIGQTNPNMAFYNSVTDNFNLTTKTHNRSAIKIKNGFEYLNNDLTNLLYPKFLAGIGLNNYFTTPDEPKYNKTILTRWDNYIINESGFYIEDDVIVLKGKISFPTTDVNIEYYDSSNVLLTTQITSTNVTSNVLFTNSITLIKPIGYSYLKLINKNAGYFLKTYSIKSEAINAQTTAVLNTKQNKLIAGENINIDITNPLNPIISAKGAKEFVIERDLINVVPSRKFVKICSNTANTLLSGKISISGDFFGIFIGGELTLSFGLYIAAGQTTISAGTSRISSQTSLTASNLGISDLMVVGGFIGFYVYSTTTNIVRVVFDGAITTSNSILWNTSTPWEVFAFPNRRPTEIEGVLKLKDAINLKSYTVATLPTGTEGDTAYVTDASTPTYLGTLTGGGIIKCPVFYNGTNWVSH